MFKIKKEDLARVLLGFFSFFTTIAAYYILKPVRGSLFLKYWTADGMPIAYLTTALTIFVVVWGYGRLTQNFNRRQLLSGVYLVSIALLVLFWFLFQVPSKAVALGFYVWVSIFNVMVVAMFWSLANDTFNPAEGKR